MKELKDLFSKPVLTEDDYVKLQKTLDALNKLQNEGDPTAPEDRRYLSKAMKESLKKIFDIMSKVGLAPGQTLPPNIGLELMNILKNTEIKGPDGKILEFKDLIGILIGDTENADKTLQDRIFLDLFSKINDKFNKKMRRSVKSSRY